MKLHALLLLTLISVIPLWNADCQSDHEQANAPALRGLRSVSVHIQGDLDSAALSSVANRGLKNAGMIVSEQGDGLLFVQCKSDYPEKNVVCNMSVERYVILPHTLGTGFMAAVWNSGFPSIDAIGSGSSATATAMDVVERHVNAFVIDWLKANRSR
jgi:hypothetical protein